MTSSDGVLGGSRAEQTLALLGRMLLAALVSPAPYVGLMFAVLVIVGGGIGGGANIWHVLLTVTFIGLAPFGISLAFSFSLRGLGGGILAILTVIVAYPVAEILVAYIPSAFQGSISWGLIGAAGIAVASVTTRYVQERRGYLGLVTGLVVGMILAALFVTNYGASIYRGDPMDAPLVLEWSAPFAFLWTSIVFFPEFFQRRAGWAGFVIWATVQASIFGVGVLVNQFWVG